MDVDWRDDAYVELPDGSSWPNPFDPLGVESRIRNGEPLSAADRLVAASCMKGFLGLVMLESAEREYAARELLKLWPALRRGHSRPPDNSNSPT